MKKIPFVLGVFALSFAAVANSPAQTILADGSEVIGASTPRARLRYRLRFWDRRCGIRCP